MYLSNYYREVTVSLINSTDNVRIWKKLSIEARNSLNTLYKLQCNSVT